MTTPRHGAALAVALLLACWASGAMARPMPTQPIGRPVAPPAGFLEFCRRQPSECRTPGQTAADDRTISREATRRFWSARFAGDADAAVERADAARIDELRLQAELETQSVRETIYAHGVDADPLAALFPAVIEPVVAVRPVERLMLTPARWNQVNGVNMRINARLTYVPDQAQYGQAEYWDRAAGLGAAQGDCEDYVLTKRHDLIAAGVPAGTLSVAVVETPRGELHTVLILAGRDGDFVLDNRTAYILRWDQTAYRWRSRQAPGAVFDWVQVAV